MYVYIHIYIYIYTQKYIFYIYTVKPLKITLEILQILVLSPLLRLDVELKLRMPGTGQGWSAMHRWRPRCVPSHMGNTQKLDESGDFYMNSETIYH